MKTVVVVSAAEVARMLAIAVLQRPENMGRVALCTELDHDAEGLVTARVEIYDTVEEAQAALPAPRKAQVLQLVPPSVAACDPP